MPYCANGSMDDIAGKEAVKLYKLGINHAAQLGTHLLLLLLFLVRFVGGKSFWGEASLALGHAFPSRQPFLRLPAGFGSESRTADCTESAVERVIESATVKLGHDLATETCLTCMWFYRSPWVCEGTLSHIHYFKNM